jgi:hypothetical protein
MNPTKLVLHFSDFPVIFYTIYKKQGNGKHYWSYPFARKTLESLLCLQCSPRGGWPARVGKIRRALRGSWSGKGKGVV